MTTGLYDRIPQSQPIDYAMMKREYPKLKSALTRATNRHDWEATLRAVERFLAVSHDVGCMPDDWPRWRNALEDAWRTFSREWEDDLDLSDIPGGFVDRFQRAAARFA